MRCIAPILLALAASSARALRDEEEEEATKVEEASSMTAVAWASRGQIAGMAAEARAHMAAGPLRKKVPTTSDWEKLWPNGFKLDPEPQCVGRGTFGTVFAAEAKCSPDLKVAVKEVNMSRTRRTREKVLEEAEYMRLVNGPRVVHLYASGATDDQVYLVMEHLGGGDLSNQRVNTQDKMRLFGEVLAGVVHIHSKGVAHLDLKPSNILLTSACTETETCHAKITDFGGACKIDESDGWVDRRVAGSPGYAAPDDEARLKSDVWSLGMILHEILRGNNPVLECVKEKKQAQDNNERLQSGKWDSGNSWVNSLADALGTMVGPWILEVDSQTLSTWEMNRVCIDEFTLNVQQANIRDQLLAGMLKKKAKDRLTAEDALKKFKQAQLIESIGHANTPEPPPDCEHWPPTPNQ